VSFFSLAFDTGARRRPQGFAGAAFKILAASAAVWTVYAAAFSQTDVLPLTIIFLAIMLVLTFLLIAPTAHSKTGFVPLHDWVLAAGASFCGAYFVVKSDEIARRITLLDDLSYLDMVVAIAIIVLTLEAMRRTVGLGLTLIVILFMAYNLFGDRLSGPMAHGEIDVQHFLDIMIFTTDGLFGVPLRVAATYAFLFVLFGTTLAKTGGAEFFFDLAASIAGKSRGGPAKIAVISSGLYGTISGSPTSDVVTTGSVTIPIMKRMGYNSAFAGGVEVAASTGGSLVPPVMGAAAFIMAEYTGIAYVDIAIAAIIPALLYYLPIYLQVDLRAHRDNLKGMDEDKIPPLSQTLQDGGLFLLPLAAITWALLEGYTPTYSALYGTLAVILVSMVRRKTRIMPTTAFEILYETSAKMVAVAGACAAAGLVIGGITMTGLASKFGNLIFLLSDENYILSLILAALLTILLGLGMPTPSAYILAAVLVSPVLSSLAIDVLSGHLFLLYFAVMSALTPPVAVAAYAASAIAEENPLRIALVAVRIAIAAFLVPFAFVFDPALLMKGSFTEIASATSLVAAGLILIVIALEGFWRSPINGMTRLAFAGVGACLLFVRPVVLNLI
jgi:TRAP transporter 4TM/12TM fusion protein